MAVSREFDVDDHGIDAPHRRDRQLRDPSPRGTAQPLLSGRVLGRGNVSTHDLCIRPVPRNDACGPFPPLGEPYRLKAPSQARSLRRSVALEATRPTAWVSSEAVPIKE
jgi:hypothetical protein